MEKQLSYLALLCGTILLLASGCKSEFEKVRISGNPEVMFAKANEYYEEEEFAKAQSLFELVIGSYRGKKEAEEIYYRYAYTYYYLGQYILASYYFNNFSNTYSASQYREETDFMAAYSHYKLSPTFRLDQTYTEKAIEDLQLYVNTYPQSERVQEANQLIDDMRAKLERKALEEAMLYFDLRQYQSAIQSFENLLKDFPETNRAEEVRYYILRSAYLLADNSFVEKQETRYRDALTRASEFIAKYPDSDHAKEVAQMLTNSKEKLNQLTNVGYQDKSSRTRS
ncbi:MAG: hypothetical protein DHS20C18_31540 [Saprospiraceae bacterium]|nr:MAG: hypothetical protein DHS20C18_31540 [Saprospiraceae bacterium]